MVIYETTFKTDGHGDQFGRFPDSKILAATHVKNRALFSLPHHNIQLGIGQIHQKYTGVRGVIAVQKLFD